MSAPSRRLASFATAAALAAVLVAGLAGCKPEPAPSPAPSVSSAGPTSATPEPSASATPGADIALPSSCAQAFSSDMTASLQQQGLPPGDPGVTMYSTQDSEALQLLGSGIPTLRCTWGTASGAGLATNVSIVTSEQATSLRASFQAQGFACAAADGGTLCSISQQVFDRVADKPRNTGEHQFLRGNGWISTHWVDTDPKGYTADIVTTLWHG